MRSAMASKFILIRWQENGIGQFLNIVVSDVKSSLNERHNLRRRNERLSRTRAGSHANIFFAASDAHSLSGWVAEVRIIA